MTRGGRRVVTSLAVSAAVAAGVLVTHLHGPGSTSPGSAPAGSAPSWPGMSAAGISGAQYQLVQYPASPGSDYGFAQIHQQTATARRSIDMSMYELADPIEISDLIAARHRGVAVRVILDRAYSGQRVNEAAYAQLQSAGVPVHWAGGAIFHIKMVVVDASVADVSTANLTSRYYSSTRDATVIDRNRAQVRAISATFTHDWAGDPTSDNTVSSPGLVWSPGAQAAMVAQINRARVSLAFTSEELTDRAVIAALESAARRDVTCRVVMNTATHPAAGLRAVQAAGCHVHLMPDTRSALFIHEKMILDDAGTPSESVLIGSQNASYTSLQDNRELSLLLNDGSAATLIKELAATFTTDFAHAHAQ